MTLIAIRALLARVPTVIWVWIVSAALVVSLIGAAYWRGRHVEKVAIHRVALADSVVHRRVSVDTATRKSDSVIAIARTSVRSSSSGREHTRAVLDAAKDSTPPTVLEVVSEQLARDSTTIAVQTAAIDTLLTERGVRIKLDTLLEHQAVFQPPGDSGLSVVAIAKDVAVIAVLVEAVRLVLQLVHR